MPCGPDGRHTISRPDGVCDCGALVPVVPESPDFDQIANRILGRVQFRAGRIDAADITWTAEQLRQVWNARGAADIAKIEADLPGVETYLRSLDR